MLLGHVHFFNKKGKLLWCYDVGNWNWVKVKSVAITDDNHVVAGTRNFEVYFFDEEGNLLWKRRVGNVWSVSATNNYVAVASDKIYFFNRDGKLLWSYKTGSNWVLSVSMTPNGSYVAAGSRDSKVYFFSKDGTLLWTYKTGRWVRSVAISDDCIVAGSDGIYFFNLTKLATSTSQTNLSVKTENGVLSGLKLAFAIAGILVAYYLKKRKL
ncbi:WD40 repeat domain-containing protein [Archaeoglobus sp.]